MFAAALVGLPDAQLAEMRGGILLPNGTSVVVGIALETRVDGMLALRTQFSTETPGVQVFAGGPGTTIVNLPETTIPGSQNGVPEVRIDRGATGTVIGAVPATLVTTVRLGVGSDAEAARLPGVAVPVTENGPAIATALGAVRLVRTAGGTITELNGPNLAVQQLVGQATGTIVANTASNRVIDNATWVNVAVNGNLLPSGLTSSIESVAQAVAARARF
ncbi:MAG: hypothetical protein ACRYG4_19680 [Janthinobacterium lividum]